MNNAARKAARAAYMREWRGKRAAADPAWLAKQRERRRAWSKSEAGRKYHREYWRSRRANDPACRARLLENKRRHRESGHGKAMGAAYARKRYAEADPATRERMRDAAFLWRNGITRAQAGTMVKRQRGRCAICCRRPHGRGHCSRLHVDHDHETRKVRAMLCANCNRALGLVREDRAVLLAMVEYLDEHAASTPCATPPSA